jgi:cyclophilin family peptidyl-prolyl cis-trans isomerase/HEAT repeat protein
MRRALCWSVCLLALGCEAKAPVTSEAAAPDVALAPVAAPVAVPVAAPATLTEEERVLLSVIAHERARWLGGESDGLMARWQHPSARVRARVARALGRIGEPAGIEPLAALALEESAEVRREAALGLGLIAAELGPEAPQRATARAAVLAAWDKEGAREAPDEATQRALLWSMGKVGGAGAEGLWPAVQGAGRSLEPAIARQALVTLALLIRFAPETPGVKGAEALSLLQERAAEVDPQIKEAALYGLMRLASPESAALLKKSALALGHEPSRALAVRALTAAKVYDAGLMRQLLLPPPDGTEEDPEPVDYRGDSLTGVEALRHLGQRGDEAAMAVAAAFFEEVVPQMAEHGTGLASPRFHLVMTFIETLPQYKDKARAKGMLEVIYKASSEGGGLRRAEASLSEEVNAALAHCHSADALDRLEGKVSRLPGCASGLGRGMSPEARERLVLGARAALEAKPEARADLLLGAYKEASPGGKVAVMSLAVELAEEARPKPAKAGGAAGAVPAGLRERLVPLGRLASEEEDAVLAAYGFGLRVKVGEVGVEEALKARLGLFKVEEAPGASLDLVLACLEGLGERGGDVEVLRAWTASPHAVVRGKALKALEARDKEAAPLPWVGVLPEVDAGWLEAAPKEALLRTTRGNIRVSLLPEVAPGAVENFVTLAKRGFYRDTAFHRVIANFVSQGGDPRGDGNGGPGWSLLAEWSVEDYTPGTLGMAHAGKDTAGSQFFFTHTWQPHLNGGYTVFGRALEGLEVIRSIQPGDKVLEVEVSP